MDYDYNTAFDLALVHAYKAACGKQPPKVRELPPDARREYDRKQRRTWSQKLAGKRVA